MKSQSHCFAEEFVITHAYSFGKDTHHDYRQGNWRTMSSIIIKLENEWFIVNFNQMIFFAWKFGLYVDLNV